MADHAQHGETGKARARSLAAEWEVIEIDKKRRDLATDHLVILVVVLTAITVSVVGSAIAVFASLL
jgi:hypothetical protein